MKNILFIVGPTGVGKSKYALDYASKHHGEIVSCDAMQVYQEINILSDKATEDMRQHVPHHLVDIISVEEEFDVVKFRELACKTIEDILAKNKLPIIVGGSGLYMSILLDGIFEGGSKDEAIRATLEKRIEEEGSMTLYHELKNIDPEAIEHIDSNDARRIVRALEVYQKTGKPISELQKNRSGLWDAHHCQILCLNRPREDVYARINARVDDMMVQGALEEVRALQNKNLTSNVRKLIGVSELLAHLNGEYDLDRAVYLIKRNTRHFAKRQLTWFRKETRLEWVNLSEVNQ